MTNALLSAHRFPIQRCSAGLFEKALQIPTFFKGDAAVSRAKCENLAVTGEVGFHYQIGTLGEESLSAVFPSTFD